MDTLKELREFGTTLGLEGADLVKFIDDQQAKQREERKLQRDIERDERESEKMKLDYDLKIKEIMNAHELELIEKQKPDTVAHAEGNKTIFPTKVPKLPPFEEHTDDMDAYLRRYERYALSQKWDKSIWATHLSALLKGNALNVYALLPPEQALDYEALKTSLLKRFDMTEDGFKQKFRSCRPESGETFQQFSVRLGGYFSRWIEMSNIPKTFAGLYDLMLRDQFLHVCNKEVSLFLKERIPSSVENMAKLADQFKEARRVNVTTLTNQQSKGNLSSLRSGMSKRPDVPRVAEKNLSSNSSGKVDRKCFRCNKPGHFISDCPLKNKVGNIQNTERSRRGKFEGQKRTVQGDKGNTQGGNDTPVCGAFIVPSDNILNAQAGNTQRPQLTSATGHKISSSMPVGKGMLGSKFVTVLRDTGCSGVVVKTSLVDEDCFLDRYQNCLLADGTSIRVPLAKLDVNTPYYKGEVIAWCMEQPIYDVIIGNIEGAREPNDPDPLYPVSAITRQQANRMNKPYPKLKVPDILQEVSRDDIKQAQQSDTGMAKIREYVKDCILFQKPNILR